MYEDAPYLKFEKSVVLRAERYHKALPCDICGKLMKKGDRFRRQFVVTDDGIWTVKRHLECENRLLSGDLYDTRS